MTWKGTFCTEYAWSLCGSSLLFSRACGRPQAATNTPRSSPNLFAFLSSHSSLLPPTHFVREESHLLSHSNRRLLATLPSFSSPCFSPRSSCLHRAFSHFLAVLVLSAVAVVVLCVRSVAGSWGRLKLCRCVCVSILVLIVFIAYEAEHLRQGLRVRVLN